MKFDCILFDFDGTVADTGPGIRRSVAYALERMGREAPGDAVLNRFIGPPLLDSFIEFCGMTEAEALRAIDIYRERYVGVGLYESTVYPGMAALMKALHEAGARVAIASSKPTFMLERLSEHFGLAGYIDRFAGVGLKPHGADKSDLILSALDGADKSRAAMVGDRRFDIEAARKVGVCPIGAGFGYAPPGELQAAGAHRVFDSARALGAWLLDDCWPRGRFITLEGSDGTGKSTQIKLLREWLEVRGWEVVVTREPGGCGISERIREVLLSLDSEGMSPECEALLYAAARVEHVSRVVEPALKLGKIVICDRFLDSSIAYQAYGRELGEGFVRLINDPALRRAAPDATLLMELDRQSARKRLAAGAPADRMEREREDFFARVQAGYEALKRTEPGRITAIDASGSIEAVHMDVVDAVGKVL